MINSIDIKGIKINFEIVIDKKLKNTYIRIIDDLVIIKGKKVSLADAHEIINRKANWILKSLDKVKLRNIQKEERAAFNKISLFGQDYDFEIIEKSVTRDISIYFNQKFFIFINPIYRDDKELLLKALNEFYRKKSESEIPSHVMRWSKVMNVSYGEISFKKMKRTWGSCSHTNNLCFNIRLSSLNQEQIDYIIVHELAHITEKNHSKNFWNLVEKYVKDHKQIHKSLMGYLS